MKKIKIAQIGIGHDHAEGAYPGIKGLSELFDVVGYCLADGDEDYPERICDSLFPEREQMTLEEILENPEIEAVVVETEEHQLVRYATMALLAGKHVQMDKPGGEDAEAFENMMRIAKEKNLVVHLGYMYRYNPAVMQVMEKVKAGVFGELYAVEAHMDCLHELPKRNWLKRFRGGMLFFLGCHLIDLIVQLQGVPEEIIPLSCSTGLDGTEAKDYGMAVFRYKNGVSFAKTSATEPGGFRRRQLVVCGENMTTELNPIERYLEVPEGNKDLICDMHTMSKTVALKSSWNLPKDHITSEPFNRYENMLQAFGEMVRGERENPYTYEYEVLLHRILLAACGFDIDYKREVVL